MIRALLSRINAGIRFAVQLTSLGENAFQISHCIRAIGHGPMVTLGEYALHMLIGLRLDPYGCACLAQLLERFRFRYKAAADGNHGALLLAKYAFERCFLKPPIRHLAAERKHFRDRQAGHRFNFADHFHERHIERICEPPTQGALACAPQPHQSDEALLGL